MLTPTFITIAALTIASAVAAMSLRNLVHCALSLSVTFAGLAMAYLQLDAQFVGFAQLLVYVGAIAILIVFAILLTRGIEPEGQSIFSKSWISGIVVSIAIFAILGAALASSAASRREPAPEVSAPIKQIGNELMTRYIVPLEVIGLLLTAALIGAVIIAMKETESK